MASIFQLPQKITSADPFSCQTDDVSSLGTATEQRRYLTNSPHNPAVVKCEDLVVQAVDVDEEDCQETTYLFGMIEKKRWDTVLMFLETNKKAGFFGLGGDALQTSTDARAQAQTWINRKDWWGSVTLRQLPLHAAVEFKAPIRIIHKLVELHPEGAKSQDFWGNLPLHLSFKYQACDSIVAFLLKAFPEAVEIQNKSGRYPVDYASAETGAIIKICVEQNQKEAKNEEEKLIETLESEKARLMEIQAQIQEVRGEINLLRHAKAKASDPCTLKNDDNEYFNEFATGKAKDCTPGASLRKMESNLPWAKKGRKVAPGKARKKWSAEYEYLQRGALVIILQSVWLPTAIFNGFSQ